MRLDWIVRLYPRRWRDRYGDELAAILDQQPPTVTLAFDLLVGAIDAYLQPRPISLADDPATPTARGGLMTPTIFDALKTCPPRRSILPAALAVTGMNLLLWALWALLHAALGVKTFAYPWENAGWLTVIILPTAIFSAWELPAAFRLRTRLAVLSLSFASGIIVCIIGALVASLFGAALG